MVYIKDIPSMGYTCRAYLICTLRKNFVAIFIYIYATYCEPFQTTPERISFFSNENLHKKNPPARSIPHILTRKTLQLYVSTI